MAFDASCRRLRWVSVKAGRGGALHGSEARSTSSQQDWGKNPLNVIIVVFPSFDVSRGYLVLKQTPGLTDLKERN